jgi:hypothetical protein
MANNPVINSFNAGELSPFLGARKDLSKYSSGCLVLENFQVLPYGGAVRRPAIEYMGEGGAGTRLFIFEFSVNDVYILEIRGTIGGVMRFYKDGELVMSGGVPYEILTPWSEAQILELKYVQSGDVMWFVHKNHPPQRLTRIADDNWTCEDMSLFFPPFVDDNQTDIALTPGTGATTVGATISISADGAVFDPLHVGSVFKVTQQKETTSINGNKDDPGASLVLFGSGEYILETTGLWTTGTLTVERRVGASGDWFEFRKYDVSRQINRNISWDENDPDAYFRVVLALEEPEKPEDTKNDTNTWRLSNRSLLRDGVVRITVYSSSTLVQGIVVKPCERENSATKLWAEGAWSQRQGYPSAIALFENRLVFAGTKGRPNTLWLSKIDEYDNFQESGLDDGAMRLTIGSGRIDEIRWLVAQKSLVIGTAGSEWVLEADSDRKPITPTAFSLKRQTTYGTSDIQGVLVNTAVLFFMRQGRKLREFTYSFDQDSYVAPDLTLLAEHITQTGIVNVGFAQQPDTLLLCVRTDGEIALMTYERDQDVVGWQRWTVTGGEVTSVAVIPRDDGGDEVWLSAKVGDKYLVGRFDPREWGSSLTTEWTGSDFYKVYTAAPGEFVSGELTGLDHLEGKKVDILADGAPLAQQTVTGGKIDIGATTRTRVVVGLPYTSKMAPMYIEPDVEWKQPMGKRKGLFQSSIRFKDTASAKIGQSEAGVIPVKFGVTGKDEAEAGLHTKEVTVRMSNVFDRLHTCYIVQDEPLPITVLAMVPSVEVYQ